MRVLDLFSGIGGFSLGLERAGMRTVAFCEIEPFARAVLRKHWPTVVCFHDVRLLGRDMLEMFGVSPIDVICGGFPCQDISLAGKGAGLDGERSGLWREFHRIIGEVRPAWVIIENVAALRSRGLDQVLGSLAAIGYDAEWHCIPASAVGHPHKRDRVWIVAHAHGQRRDGLDALLQPRGPQQDRAEAAGGGAPMAHPGGEGLPAGRPLPICAESIQSLLAGGGHHRTVAGPDEPQREWESPRLVERPVGGRTDGLPVELVRLANAGAIEAFGNAVVPQIPEIIGRAIMAHEHRLPHRDLASCCEKRNSDFSIYLPGSDLLCDDG